MNPDDYEGHKLISQQTIVPIATGENEYTRYGFRDLIENRCCAILQPDGLIMGGITEFMKVAAMAQAPTTCPSRRTATRTCTCTWYRPFPTASTVEYYRGSTDPMWDKKFKHTLMVEDGHVSPPDRPGIGIEPDEEALAPYRVA